MAIEPVLINGQWRSASGKSGGAAGEFFHAENPATGEQLPHQFPISSWADVDAALNAAVGAMETLRHTAPQKLADFLNRFAQRLEGRTAELVQVANEETGLAVTPRLQNVELPRTTTQLRQAAAAAADGGWSLPTIDTKLNIRSYLAGIGPVAVFGPNNFPFAFNSAAGGDFAAAIAAGCPVIAKANPSHPRTTQLMTQEAFAAAQETGLPPATVQLIYRTDHESGARFVSDPRLGACAYTGARSAGLKLKAAADAAGKPIYLELSSVNPVLMLPGALTERLAKVTDEFVDSSLMGTGQFCTNPSIVMLLAGELTEQFIAGVQQRFESRPTTPLLSNGVCRSLDASVAILRKAGARVVTGGSVVQGKGYRFANTLLRVDGEGYLAHAEELQTEAFGNAALMVVAKDATQLIAILGHLEGNLTGCVYSDTQGSDDALYQTLVPHLRPKVGRLLNDKMPTGVALSPAMNHGGPYPCTGHAGFTAVGIPASMRRFGMLQCFDNVRPNRLPSLLQDKAPNPQVFRLVDGAWTRGDVSAKA